MKNPDRETTKRILQQPYMTMKDFYMVLPVGRKQSDRIFNELERKLKDENVPLFNTQPKVIPTEHFKKYLKEKSRVTGNASASSSDI